MVSATATPVEKPRVSACGCNARVANACVGVGELLVCDDAFGFYSGDKLC